MGGFNVDPEEMGRLRTELEGTSSSFLERTLPENPGVSVLGDPGVDGAMSTFVEDAGTHHTRFGNRFSYLSTAVADFSDQTQDTDETWGATFERSYLSMDLAATVRRLFGTD